MKRESDHSGRLYDNLGVPPDAGLGKRAVSAATIAYMNEIHSTNDLRIVSSVVH